MCSCQRIGKKRRIGNMKFNASSLTPAFGVAAGYLVSKQADRLLDKIPVVNTNIGKAIAKVALGFVLSGNKRGVVSNIGTGMIVGAVTDTVSGFMNKSGTEQAFRLLSGIRGTGLTDQSQSQGMIETLQMNKSQVKYA